MKVFGGLGEFRLYALGFASLGLKGSGHKNLGSSRAQQFRFSGSERSGSGFGRSLRALE